MTQSYCFLKDMERVSKGPGWAVAQYSAYPACTKVDPQLVSNWAWWL